MADLTLPTPNKTPGDGSPADDTNLIIEAINTLNSAVENIPGVETGVLSVDGRVGVVTLSDLYDAAGDASAAQTAAEAYADSLASNYDPAGSASAAQTAAQSYADGLAVNYDPAGSSSSVAGDLTTHEGLTTSVHGISNTANLVYTSDSRLSDARTPTAHATSHENGGSDELELAPSQVTGTAIVANDVHLISFVTSGTRPGSPTEGQVIYETDTDTYFGWKGSSWLPIGGGATGGDTDDVFYENSKNVTTSYTLTTGKNAMTAGPVEIDSGATVTIPSGSNWVVV